ncbi:hypothetical protein VTO42DRAFT_7085 [Malbranchea cinnamomea]
MSLTGHACRRTVQQQRCRGGQFLSGASSGPDHVWISDDCLARAFARFVGACVGVGQQRRHGSSVPGPLEARRRLNKRRNMNLAGARAGMGMGPDVAVLFGAASSDHSGYAATDSRTRSSTGLAMGEKEEFRGGTFEPRASSIPRISIFSPSPPPPPPLNPFAETQSTPPQVASEKRLLSQLSRATTIEGIRSIFEAVGPSPEQLAQLSEECFDNILLAYREKSQWRVADLHAFLSDPILNPRDAANFAKLVQFLVDHEVEVEELEQHASFLGRMVKSGHICHGQLVAIVKRIPNIKVHNGTLRERNPERLNRLLETLWDSAVTSSAIRPKHVRPSLWLDILLSGKPHDSSFSAVQHILCHPCTKMTTHQATKYIIHGLRLAVSKGHVPAEITHSTDGKLMRYLALVTSVGERLGPKRFATCITQVTEALVFSSKYETARPSSLTLWAWILQRIQQAHYLLLQKRVLRDVRCQRVESEGAFEASLNHRCALRLWVVTLLGFHTSHSNSSRYHRRETFLFLVDRLQTSSSENSDTLTLLVDLLQDLGNRGVPLTQPVVTAAARCAYRTTLNKASDASSLVDQLVALVGPDRLPIAKLLSQFQGHKGSYPEPQYGPHPWFQRLAQSVDITSSEFIDEVIRHIETPSPRRSILLNILRNHTGAKIALGLSHKSPKHASTPQEKHGKPYVADTSDPATSYHTPDGRFIPHPAACLETFHVLALVFAFSPKLSPRAAWKLTYWCYRFLASHNAPIKPIMVRALYYAGIVRFREERRVLWGMKKFVANLVRKVEGPEVARRIMKWKERTDK